MFCHSSGVISIKALVYQDHKTVSYLDVPDPSIEAPTDAIVRIEKTAICS